MGNGEEQFCLRWNDFQDSILSTLQDLRAEEDFVDVTLVCDGEQIRAHKLILSACSDFFRHLLKKNPAANPVIVLWDMSIDDIRNILRFMYNGEVEVQQTHLNTFLSVAERLRVRGLCQSGGKSPNPSSSAENHRSSASPPPPPPAKASSSSSQHRSGSSSIRRSSSPSHPRHHHHHRRRSHDAAGAEYSPAPKKSKVRSPSTEEVSVKEESREGGSHSPPHQSSSSLKGGDHGGSQDESSMMSRSGAESEADYSEFGYGAEGFDDHGGIPTALMAGMSPRGMLDPATAKELWRRAAMARMSLGSSNSGSPPTNPFHHRSPLDGSSSEPARRQRSVYTSHQIGQLEAYFQFNEYIDGERKKQLARLTNIPEQQIKVWFQNRRQKKKREQDEQPHNVDPHVHHRGDDNDERPMNL